MEIEKKVKLMKAAVARELQRGPKYLQVLGAELNEHVAQLENARNLQETWIHIDMDMFYAAVELKEAPALATRPVAVENNGTVATANYIAREFGVKSALPVSQARALCPQLTLIPASFSKYRAESERIKEIFKRYDPAFEACGLDEAYLCLTAQITPQDSEARKMQLAAVIRHEIYMATGLTASAGIACNRLLAKLCSAVNKPDGQFLVPPEPLAICEFIKTKAVRKVPGIGNILGRMLAALDIYTCAEIIEKKLQINIAFSKSQYEFLIRSALGLGITTHSEFANCPRRSFTITRSFTPTSDWEFILEKFKELTSELTDELAKKTVAAKTLCVKVKTGESKHYEETKSSPRALSSYEEVHGFALQLMQQLHGCCPVRAITVKGSSFVKQKKEDSGQTKLVRERPNEPAKKNKKPLPKFLRNKNSEFEELFNKFSSYN